ncbi:MAG: prepilin-type N-terminal cleavage/methylation domain-containing protein [Candidatus Saccharimonadales bacterium]
MEYSDTFMSFRRRISASRKLRHETLHEKRPGAGFTIVELLIVVVVIGVLAAIVIVAYNGVQQRARDANRMSDVTVINKALELYYIDYGRFPNGSGSTTINSGWSTTADASWQNLATALQPYLSKIPVDPVSAPNLSPLTNSAGYNYAYFSNTSSGVSYCGAAPNQMYILIYRFESSSQTTTLNGACPSSPLGPYGGASNYRMNKS